MQIRNAYLRKLDYVDVNSKNRNVAIDEMDKLVYSFCDSLINPSEEIVVDILEVGIDSIIDNEIIREIPIIKTICSAVKIGQAINERNLMSQTIVFIKELNSGIIDQKELENHRLKLKSNPKKAEKELGRVLFLLNRNIECQKAKYYAKLYASYIKQEIDWKSFCEMCDVVERLFLSDIELLQLKYGGEEVSKFEAHRGYVVCRLESMGLLFDSLRTEALYPRTEDYSLIYSVQLSKLGEDFCKIIFGMK